MKLLYIVLSTFLVLWPEVKGEARNPDGQIGIETVVARGPHSDVHQIIEEVVLDGNTNLVAREWEILQTGLNFWSETEMGWVPSSKTIELADTGAVFKNGPIKIRFAANQNDVDGAIEFTLPFPDQRKIRMQTIGIALTDGENSVWIGELQNANGMLDGNTIVYPNAFSGVKADIQMRIEDGGQFHNDVVLRERLDPVLLRALDMDPARCRIEVWHQILECPQGISHPGFIKRADGSIDFDEQLEFSDGSPFTGFFIGPGAAFLVGTNRTPIANAKGKIPVAKTRFNDAQTHSSFLIESIPYADAQTSLQTLPGHEEAFNLENLKSEIKTRRQTAGLTSRGKPVRLQSLTTSLAQERGNRKMAVITESRQARKPGLVLDYTVIPTASNFRFVGTTTYYVTNAVTLSGTTTIEKGTVVKFANSGNPVVNVSGSVDCETDLGMPAIFTSKDDDSVGEIVSGSSGSPSGTYGVYNLLFTASNLEIHDIFTRFAQTGLGFQGSSISIENIQAIRCGRAIESCNNTLTVRNLLAHDSTTVFAGTNTTINAEHVTAHTATQLFTYSGTGALNLTNSLIIGVTNIGSGVITGSSATNADDTGIFQTVKAGSHYLANGSAHRNAGTAALTTPMLTLLAKTTTYPPVELAGTISMTTILRPEVQRDTDAPDLGAHFPPIDFIWGGLTIGTNTTLILTNGVVVAVYNSNATLLQSGGRFVSEGLPLSLNKIVRYQAIQEQPIVVGTTSSTMTLFTISGAPTTRPDVTMRFSSLFIPAASAGRRYICNSSVFGSIRASHSEWHNLIGQFDPPSGNPAFALTNNILSRCDLTFTRAYDQHSMALDIWNNYIRFSTLNLYYQSMVGSPPVWFVKDNFFDSTIIQGSNAGQLFMDNNGFYNTTIPTFTAGHDASVTSLDFVSGPRGRNYYATSGTGTFRLVGAGSRTAGAAGLSHFTVRADQKKDTGTVDIGFHPIAVETVWVEDALPNEMSPGGGGTWDENFHWTNSTPGPVSGLSFHMATPPPVNLRQSYFVNSQRQLAVGSDDILFAYVYVGNTNVQTVMLQWCEGLSWDHRAYWGLTNDATLWSPKTYMGPLPAVGSWVRLEVSALAVDLQNKDVHGMAFTFDGNSAAQVSWDRGGSTAPIREINGTTSKILPALPVDSDGDGLPDYLEDADGDNVTDTNETSIVSGDTDGDGLLDGVEVLLGYNPLKQRAPDSANSIAITILTPLKD